MIAIEIALTVLGGIVAVGAALYQTHKKSIPCDSCAFLIKKGGFWKYTCKRADYFFTDSFDKPPEYCKYYKPKEEGGRGE